MTTIDDGNVFKEETWPKICSSCKFVISEDDWETFPYIGIQKGTGEISDLEMRNCNQCYSTLAIIVSHDFLEEDF